MENELFGSDKEELKSVISRLKLRMFMGCENTCPSCKHIGGFGSIVKYKCESEKEYLVCGWCGEVTEL